MSTSAKKKAHIVRSFTDKGTGESFTAGATPMIEVGAFGNYEAAGLVRAATTERKPRAAVKTSEPAAPSAPTE